MCVPGPGDPGGVQPEHDDGKDVDQLGAVLDTDRDEPGGYAAKLLPHIKMMFFKSKGSNAGIGL